MATATSNPQLPQTEKKKRQRSPNYPSVGLKEAIERAKRFYQLDGRAGAKADIAAKHIGFASAHGQAYSVLSALKKFGLLDDKDGRVVPTARAIEIFSLPDTDERRLAAIRKAAMSPQIYAELIEDYKDTGLPHAETLAGELQAYKGFNPNAIKEFLKAFNETLEFAGLTDLTVLGSEPKLDEETYQPQVGDYVQWESQGTLRFTEPKRIRSLSEDGQWAFVEGSLTGIPTKELSPEKAPAVEHVKQPPITTPPIEGVRTGGSASMRQDVFSVTEGNVMLSWPATLSMESIEEIKDWLKIAERKIQRSQRADTPPDSPQPE